MSVRFCVCVEKRVGGSKSERTNLKCEHWRENMNQSEGVLFHLGWDNEVCVCESVHETILVL